MTYTEYLTQVDEAKQKSSIEDFLSEYRFNSNCLYNKETLLLLAEIIFTVAHNDWKSLTEVAGENIKPLKKVTNFARFFDIPLRSLRHWIDGTRIPPMYTTQLVGYAIISELLQNYDL